MTERSLRSSAGINLLGNIFAAGASALALIIAARHLGVGEWGLAVGLMGVGQFSGSLLNWGSSTYALRTLGKAPADRSLVESVRFLIVRLLSGALIITAAIAVGFFWPTALGLSVLIAGTFIGLGTVVPSIARGRYVTAALLVVGEKTTALVAVALLVGLDALTPDRLLFAIGGAGVLGGAVALVVLWVGWRASNLPAVVVRGRDILTQWRGSRHFGVASIAPSALLLDVTIVGAIAGAHEAGLYAIGSRLAGPLSVAATTVAQVLLPTLARSPSRRIEFRWSLKRAVGLGVLVVVIVVGIVLVPPALVLVLGGEYTHATTIVRLFIANALVVLVTRTLVTVLQAWGAERSAAYLVACQVVLALGWISIAAALGGATTAALGTLLSNMLLAIALGARVRTLAHS